MPIISAVSDDLPDVSVIPVTLRTVFFECGLDELIMSNAAVAMLMGLISNICCWMVPACFQDPSDVMARGVVLMEVR